jgi:TPR repeat protein
MKRENINRYALIVRAAECEVDVARRLAEPLLEAGDPDVHWCLGYLCQCGLYETPDKGEARQWFQKAAALGSTLGKSALAALDALPSGHSDGGYFVVDAKGVTHIGDGWPDPIPHFGDGSSPSSPEDCERM